MLTKKMERPFSKLQLHFEGVRGDPGGRKNQLPAGLASPHYTASAQRQRIKYQPG